MSISNAEAKPPQVFISYSWTTQDHEQWVLEFAEELNRNGVHVLLDKWDLKEGHDANVFMEKMVNDPEVSKVLLICDEGYVRKTNRRQGGVGTEAQIISPEIYGQQDQTKFIAVVVQRDENGRALLPTYYQSRIYIDLSDSTRYSENIEKLIRSIFNKPLHARPKLGAPPSYISDPDQRASSTASLARRAEEALRSGKIQAVGALSEYLQAFATQLAEHRVPGEGGLADERFMKSLEAFLPLRDEWIQVIQVMVGYVDPILHHGSLKRFIEALFTLYEGPERSDGVDAEFFRFVGHELFLFLLAILIREEKFDAANLLLSERYYMRARGGSCFSGDTVDYVELRTHSDLLQQREQRLFIGWPMLRADLLKERCVSSGVDWGWLMQADFICYLRAELRSPGQISWFPETLAHALGATGAFEIFARSISLRYLVKVFVLLEIQGTLHLEGFCEKLATNGKFPNWRGRRLPVARLLGLHQLGQHP